MIFTTVYRNRVVQFPSLFLLSPVSFWQICFFGPDLMHSKTLINTGEKKIAGIACFTIPTIFQVVAGEGFEPTTSGLWARRATSCSTPRYSFSLEILSQGQIKVKNYFSDSQYCNNLLSRPSRPICPSRPQDAEAQIWAKGSNRARGANAKLKKARQIILPGFLGNKITDLRQWWNRLHSCERWQYHFCSHPWKHSLHWQE